MNDTASPSFSPLSIAVLGGSGKEGSGLAFRWAHAGHHVTIGSRDPAKAAAAAAELDTLLGGRATVKGSDNLSAARVAQVVVLAVPYAAQRETAMSVRDALEGKVLVDVTVPLVPPKVDRVQLPGAGSAVQQLQVDLGAGVKVVSAFQNVSAVHLKDPSHPIDCDVLVCGDDADARELVVGLALDAGIAAWHAGVLANSAASEALTSVLIAINKRYKIPGSGIRITGLPRS
jgi:NADPH-dependent F420 reductase